MKKSFIAISALSLFAGSALAQSNLTLYGTLDLGYGVGNNGIYEGQAGNESKFQQWGNSRDASVWGLKGSEDLGNGNKVYFQLESEIDPENGASNGFDRVSIIGFSGAFGSLQAGRQNTISSNIMTEFDVSGTPGLTSSLGNAAVSGNVQRFMNDTYERVDSALAYTSPNFNGFEFQAGFVLKNNDIFGYGAAGLEAKNIYSLGATYQYLGLVIGAVLESKPVSATGVSSSWGVGAKYDFGKFLLSASYFDNHYKDDGKGFSIGATLPMDSFTFGAQIAYNHSARYAGNDVKPLAWELFTTYDLSNRTQLYVQYGGMNNDAKKFNEAARKYSASFGMIHHF